MLFDYVVYPTPWIIEDVSRMVRLELVVDEYWGSMLEVTLRDLHGTTWDEAKAKELVRRLWLSMDRQHLTTMDVRLIGSFGTWEAISSYDEDDDNEEQRARVDLRLDMEHPQ